ncbi:hypothetical protein ACG1VR_09925 [Cedecea davisae]
MIEIWDRLMNSLRYK